LARASACATALLACLRVGAGCTVPEPIRKRAPLSFIAGNIRRIRIACANLARAKKENGTMEKFIEVAKVKEISPGQARLIHFGYQSIAIFNVGGAFYATDEFCTGDGGSLSEGTLIVPQSGAPLTTAPTISQRVNVWTPPQSRLLPSPSTFMEK
jgi:Rieske [2Fe-2S] domain